MRHSTTMRYSTATLYSNRISWSIPLVKCFCITYLWHIKKRPTTQFFHTYTRSFSSHVAFVAHVLAWRFLSPYPSRPLSLCFLFLFLSLPPSISPDFDFDLTIPTILVHYFWFISHWLPRAHCGIWHQSGLFQYKNGRHKHSWNF